MLQSGSSTSVSFNVNVMGTSTEPTVRVVLSTSPETRYLAHKTSEGKWSADIAVPESTAPGSYDLKVEVLLNNRMFTPVVKKVQIDAPAVPANARPVPIEPMMNIGQTPAPVQTERKAPAPLMQTVLTPSLEFEAQKAPTEHLGLMKAIAKAAPKRKFEALSSGMPKGSSVPVKPIKVTISEIDASTAKIKTHIREATASNPPAKTIVKVTPKTPVKLIKEHLFYE